MVNILKNKNLLIGLILLLVIISLGGAIYIINSKSTTNLADYNNLKQKTEEASKISKIANNQRFNVYLKRLQDLDNPNLSKDQQLKYIKAADEYLYEAYLETNDPELRKLSLEFKKFVEANFTEKDYKVFVECLDPSCANSSIPKEIQVVIDEINKSDLPVVAKNDFIPLLKTFSYINDEQTKVIDFLGLAASIRVDPDFIKAGMNEEISNEIRDYVKATYPDTYNKYIDKIKVQAPPQTTP